MGKHQIDLQGYKRNKPEGKRSHIFSNNHTLTPHPSHGGVAASPQVRQTMVGGVTLAKLSVKPAIIGSWTRGGKGRKWLNLKCECCQHKETEVTSLVDLHCFAMLSV